MTARFSTGMSARTLTKAVSGVMRMRTRLAWTENSGRGSGDTLSCYKEGKRNEAKAFRG